MDLILLLLFLSVAQVDGEQFTTLTREKIGDMFKVLADKLQVLLVWKEITGIVTSLLQIYHLNLASANFLKDKLVMF